MRLNLALILFMILTTTALASPVKITSGSYDISFDMNTTSNYTVKSAEPMETQTSWINQILIKTDNSTVAQISIIESKNLTDATLSTGELLMEKDMKLMGYSRNVIGVKMEKDGREGFFLTGTNPYNITIFNAYYWLDSKECECGPVSVGKTEVSLMSTYTINETLSLLSSLNVKKIMQPNDQKPLSFAPPK